ncbi:3-phosphoshikimate 1-carboxyvinyltransferase [Winogradskyella sp. 3972H.M.0a.05]|uniref:3-phosphoshikimate 1-carboxyvinyltransferase n=1 Tax=Winogradskyella sp. 3972H.M.0a.05 TaxID=2950277 RepID=UPI00339816DA
MQKHLHKSSVLNNQTISITGSKSESNRALLLQALYPAIQIENLSNSDDTQLMQAAFKNQSGLVDIHHAGTAMRFLTAYFATRSESDVILTGSSRMKERPIKILVEALRSLGSEISYLETEGCPPLKIKGKSITEKEVELKADVSSQYISALLLIAPSLNNGLKLTLKGKITSVPYIKMTLALLNEIGVKTNFEENVIEVEPFNEVQIETDTLVIESDWSSVSYFYSIVALSKVGTKLQLSSYKKDSLQGDSVLAEIYKEFGVETTFIDNAIILNKIEDVNDDTIINLDLSNAPDIAQTIAVTAFGHGIGCDLTGLHTLKIKETDRLVALKTELEKLGAKVHITDDSLQLFASKKIKEDIAIDTYKDHRMAMAFAPLALRVPITINEHDVVSKSYPDFWTDLEKIGIKSKE